MHDFNTRHFMFIIWGTAIVSLKTYPSIFLKDAGRDSCAAVILSSIVLWAYFSIIIAACKKNNCYSLYEIYTCCTGKIIGTILTIFFVVNLFLAIIESNAVNASVIHTNFLLETPIWYMLIFFVAAGIFSEKKGIYSVVCISITGIILIFINGITLAVFTAPQKHFSNLLPLFKDSSVKEFITCFLKSLGLYGCIMISFPYIKLVKDKSTLHKYSTIALAVMIPIIIFGIMGILATFVPERASSFFYPKIIQTQLINVTTFIENGELYALFKVTCGWFIKCILAFSAMDLILKEVSHNKKFNKYIIYITGIIVYLASWISSKNIDMLFNLLNCYSYICLFNFVIIPSLIFTIYFFKSSSDKNSQKKQLQPK